MNTRNLFTLLHLASPTRPGRSIISGHCQRSNLGLAGAGRLACPPVPMNGGGALFAITYFQFKVRLHKFHNEFCLASLAGASREVCESGESGESTSTSATTGEQKNFRPDPRKGRPGRLASSLLKRKGCPLHTGQARPAYEFNVILMSQARRSGRPN